MTKETLFNAINQTAKDLGLNHWIEVKYDVFAPIAMTQLASILWVKNYPENENTKIIREQLYRLWYEGAFKFD